MEFVEEISSIPAGEDTIVITVPHHLSLGQRDALRASIDRNLPGRNVFVAEGGMQVSVLGQVERLARIEEKLDALLEALAEEDEAQDKFDLDGRPLDGGERDQNQSLD